VTLIQLLHRKDHQLTAATSDRILVVHLIHQLVPFM